MKMTKTWEQLYITMIIVAIPICILGLTGNALVIAYLLCVINKTNFTMYVLNIAFADFTVLLYQFIYFLLFLNPAHVNESVSFFMEMMYLVGHNGSFYILTALCVERCISVIFPFWYHHRRPKYFSIFFCTMMWTFACLTAYVKQTECYQRFFSYLKVDSIQCHNAFIFQSIIDFLIFVPIMIFSTLASFYQKKKKQIPQAILDITINVIVTQFLLFEASIKTFDITDHWLDLVYLPEFIGVLFVTITNSVTPFIYFVIGRHYKERAWEPLEIFLERALQCKIETEQADGQME